MRRTHTTLALAAAAALFSALTWTAPGFDVAYGSEGMHIALNAIAGCVALLVGALAWSNFARTRRLEDLLLAAAFGFVVVVQQLFLLALPTLLNAEVPRPFSEWAAAATSVLAALLVAVSAFAPARLLIGRRATAAVGGVLLVALAATAVTFLMLEPRLPLVVEPGLSPVNPRLQPFSGESSIVAIESVCCALLLGAAARLTTRSGSTTFLRGWLAPALTVAAVAHANYALFPSLYSYWIYGGDILSLVASATLAWGIVSELRLAARRAVETAVLEERRRVARDLHDGLAQELAFVSAELQDLPPTLHPSLPWIRSAVERALFESRSAIAALTQPLDVPLAWLVAAEAGEISTRNGVTLLLDLDKSLDAAPPVREAILRVVREAVTNAIRHGKASAVRVTLEQVPAFSARLTITDDGIGLEEDASCRGFGLTSMRERVAASNGSLLLSSAVNGGTTVEARWPAQAATGNDRSRMSSATRTVDGA